MAFAILLILASCNIELDNEYTLQDICLDNLIFVWISFHVNMSFNHILPPNSLRCQILINEAMLFDYNNTNIDSINANISFGPWPCSLNALDSSLHPYPTRSIL